MGILVAIPEGIILDNALPVFRCRFLEQHQGEVAHRTGCCERMVAAHCCRGLPRGRFPTIRFNVTLLGSNSTCLCGQWSGMRAIFPNKSNCLCNNVVLSGFASARDNTS